jgi:hypothetical protein
VADPEAERVTLFNNPLALQYLMDGIASARSLDELTRMRRLAHAHYSGIELMELEAEIDFRARSLPTKKPATSTSTSPQAADSHPDERAVGG